MFFLVSDIIKKKYLTVKTVPKSKKKIRERGGNSIPLTHMFQSLIEKPEKRRENTHIHDRSLSWLGTHIYYLKKSIYF
jgi:hypothetical protein